MTPHEHIILPLDVSTLDDAVQLVSQLKDEVGVFKIGLEFLNSVGLAAAGKLRDAGASRIFVDAKLHDIPNTVAGAMRGIVRAGAWCVTVHTTGAGAMLAAAVEAARCEAEAVGITRPLILGVTVLTSISDFELHTDLGIDIPLGEYATHLARLAHKTGCDGVIASPSEVTAIREAIPDRRFLIVTPGVRPAGVEHGDQARARVGTPAGAIAGGADYLVIGRPISKAPDPVAAARLIAKEIESALVG